MTCNCNFLLMRMTGDNVTFHYTRHEDNQTITECIPALDFIKDSPKAIPEKHFKMLRYYGIYAKHHKCGIKTPTNVFHLKSTDIL